MSCSSGQVELPGRTERAVYGVTVGLWFLSVVLGVVWVLRNRSRQVVAKRQPHLMVLMFLSVGLFVGLALLAKILPHAPCAGVQIPLFTAFVLMANVLIVRMYLLYLSHSLSLGAVKFYDRSRSARLIDGSSSTDAPDDLQALKRKTSLRMLLAFVGSKTVLELIPILCVTIVFKGSLSAILSCDECSRYFRALFLAIAFPSVYNLAFYAFGFSKIRKLQDSLGIKTEFKIYVFVTFSGVFLAMLFFFSGLNEKIKPHFDGRTFIVLVVPMTIGSVWLSKNFHDHNHTFEKRMASTENSVSSPAVELLELSKPIANLETVFQHILQTESFSEVFKQHLQREFSVENLLFYQELQNLKKVSAANEVPFLAKRIFDNYIALDSVLMINISGDTRSKIEQVFQDRDEKKWTAEIFKDAEIQIYQLMLQDSFPRFIRSELYSQINDK